MGGKCIGVGVADTPYHEADENDHFIGEEQASLISDELTLNISRAE